MGRQADLRRVSRAAFLACIPSPSDALRSFFTLGTLLFCSTLAHAQFQQPFVFSSAGAVMTRNDQTGVLTPVSGSPFPSAQIQALDVQGRFLFGLGTNAIHMYQVNATTGAFSEVPHSPFASPNTNRPTFLAVEPTGQFLAVVNQLGRNPGDSSIETFKIDATNRTLVPVSGSFLELDSSVIGAGADLKNRHFYVFLGPNPSSSNPALGQNSELGDYTMDPQTVFLSGGTSSPGNHGRCFAMDSHGRFLVIGQGEFDGQVGVFPIAAATGALGTPAITSLAQSVFPINIATEVSGNFVYLTDSLAPSPPVHIYSLDPQTQLLTEAASSPLPGTAFVPSFMEDPTGPFMYGLTGTTIQAYMTDPQTGYFTAVQGTSLSAPGVNGSFVFSIPPGQQNVVGPVATLAPPSLSLGNITVGTPSPAQVVTLTSTGDQGLSLNSISITGANFGEFSERDDCRAPTVLLPSKSCTISVIFTPSATGTRQATLTVTDNAPGSPQPVQLSGFGVAPPPPKPAVTLMPGSLSFPPITQGTTSGPMMVTVTNSGNATLHISSLAMGGNNPNDFVSANTCVGAFQANATCTVTVTFAPLAAGQRTETITLADDASDSPQVINVGGNANQAFSAAPAPGSSTAASVTAGQVAQYQMQLTPGSGYSGSVSMACSGAPLGATCQVPSSVPVANGTPAPFTVTVKTSGGAILPPSTPPGPKPFGGFRLFPVLLALVLFMMIKNRCVFEKASYAKRLLLGDVCVAIVFCAALSVAGCGAGSSVTAPPPVITPSGTSTIILMPTAMSSSGQPLQLPPIPLTLTVK